MKGISRGFHRYRRFYRGARRVYVALQTRDPNLENYPDLGLRDVGFRVKVFTGLRDSGI